MGTMTKVGDRIEIVALDDPYTNLKPGDRGTVTACREVNLGHDRFTSFDVDWDKGSHLSLIPEAGDEWKKVDE